MNRKNPTIFLGDLVRALGELRITDAAAVELVAEMLGFEISPDEETSSASALLNRATGVLDVRDNRTTAEDDEEEEAPAAAEPERRAVPIEVTLSSGEKGEWISDVEPFPPQEDIVLVEPPPLEPLFTPRWTRGILSAAIATSVDDGPLDVGRVAEIIANCQVVKRLPTIPTRTLRRGAHLLLDKSRAMMPYARDQAWLTREILNVIGESHVEVFRFAGTPLRGAGTKSRPWPLYRPPLPGTTVVLLTDLGICHPSIVSDRAGEEEWAEFGDAVRRAGCPLIAFVPYNSSRWPPKLTRFMTIIQWDRKTTAATVGKVQGLTSEVLRP